MSAQALTITKGLFEGRGTSIEPPANDDVRRELLVSKRLAEVRMTVELFDKLRRGEFTIPRATVMGHKIKDGIVSMMVHHPDLDPIPEGDHLLPEVVFVDDPAPVAAMANIAPSTESREYVASDQELETLETAEEAELA